MHLLFGKIRQKYINMHNKSTLTYVNTFKLCFKEIIFRLKLYYLVTYRL